jgi:hypothetical protein
MNRSYKECYRVVGGPGIMHELSLFIFNTQQVFLAITLLSFVAFFLKDVEGIRQRTTLSQRQFMSLLVTTVSFGTFAILLNEWGILDYFMPLNLL